MTRETIERLEALERAATAGPIDVSRIYDEHTATAGYQLHCAETGNLIPFRWEDAEAIEATYNALPDLLAMARAVVEWSDAYRACFDMTLDRESRNAVVAECRAAWNRLYRLAIADAWLLVDAARGKQSNDTEGTNQ